MWYLYDQKHTKMWSIYGQGKVFSWKKTWNKMLKRFKLLRVTCDSSAIFNFVEKVKKKIYIQIFQGQWAYPNDKIWAV